MKRIKLVVFFILGLFMLTSCGGLNHDRFPNGSQGGSGNTPGGSQGGSSVVDPEETSSYLLTYYEKGLKVHQEKLEAGEEFELIDSRKTPYGYTFIGWSTDEENYVAVDFNQMPEENVDLFAHYEKAKYTITFVPHINVPEGTNLSKTYEYRDRLGDYVPEDLQALMDEQTDYVFEGWYLDPLFEEKFVAMSMPAEDLTLYAKWQFAGIRFINGNEVFFEYVGDAGQALEGLEAAPTKAGYDFQGWVDSRGNEVEFPLVITEDVQYYYASFTPKTNIQYKVEHYLENLYGSFVLEETEDLRGTTDAFVEATWKSYVGFSKDLENDSNVLKGAVEADGSLVLRLYYARNSYKVTFNTNGGTPVESQTYKYGEVISKPATPSKLGYSFVGWELDGKEYTFGEMPAKDITLTANWGTFTYYVTFMAEGKQVGEKIPYTVENPEIDEPKVPTKAHYTGVWQSYELTNGNVTINAIYTPIEYTITFIALDKEVAKVPYTVKTEEITVPTVPAKEHYTGVWGDYNFNGGNQEVKAIYTAIEYTITFIAQDKEVAKVPYTVETKEIKAPEVPAKAHYTAAWSSYNLNGGNQEVKAIYTAIEYTITFIALDKEVAKVPYTVETESIQVPAVPAKEHYTGVWGTYNFNGGDQRVVATYTADTYYLTFTADGKQVGEKIPYTVETKEINAPEVPAKAHYTAAWSAYNLNGGNQEVKAIYTAIEYTITFVALDKEVAKVPYTVETESIQVPAVPAKEHYTGVWGTYNLNGGDQRVVATYSADTYYLTFTADGKQVGEKIPYTVETKEINAPEVPAKAGYTSAWESYNFNGGNKEVKAIYTRNNYTITFDTNGGTAIDAITQGYGTTVTAPTAPTKEGYIFAGWDQEFPETMPLNGLTLKAKWVFNVTFVTNGGTAIDAMNGIAEGQVVTLPTATKDGYEFIGWYDNAEFNGDAITTVNKNATVYAKFETLGYFVDLNLDGGHFVFKTFDDFAEELIRDYSTWAAEFCEANGLGFVTLVGGIPTFSGDGKAISKTNWSNAMENVFGNAAWSSNLFFEDERFEAKWGWFYNFYAELLASTPMQNGSVYGYDATHKYAWRQALQAYFTGTYWASWPNSPDFSNRDDSKLWSVFEEQAEEAKYKSTSELPTPYKNRYTFEGWYDNPEFTGNPVNTLTQNTTLYAKWTHNGYSVDFELNGGHLEYETFDDFVNELIKDYGTWAAEFCETNGLTYVTLANGVPTHNGSAISKTNWSGAMENVFGNGAWSSVSFFEDDRFEDKWEWFYNFYAELLASTPMQNGSVYGYDATHKYAWRQALQAYFTGTYCASWPNSPDFSNRDDSSLWLQIEELFETQQYHAIEELPNAYKQGYEFLGWYDNPEFTGEQVVEFDEDIKLYAKFIKRYTINYDLDGGIINYQTREDLVADFIKDANELLGKSSNPTSMTQFASNFSGVNAMFTKSPYAAKWGWLQEYIIASTSETLVDGVGTPVVDYLEDNEEAYTRYALGAFLFKEQRTSWPKSEDFSNEEKANGFWDELRATQLVAEGIDTTVLPTNVYKEHYTFAGWYLNDKIVTEVTDAASLVAKWTPNTYTVTFKADGQEVAVKEYTVENLQIEEPVVPAKEGHSGSWEAYTLTSGNIIVNAEYTTLKYSVTFKDGNETLSSEELYYGTEISQPADLEKVGYNFLGWSIEFPATVPAMDLVIEARWEVIEYTLTFGNESIYTFNDSIPSGLAFDATPSYYGNGGLKLTSLNRTLTTDTLPESNNLVVTLVIGALNAKGNVSNDTTTPAFTIYGLDSNDEVVATEILSTVEVGRNQVTLSGNGIVKVQIKFTNFPYDGAKQYNVNLSGVEFANVYATSQKTYGTDISNAAPLLERTGYTFAGWLLDGQAYELTTMPNSNLTLSPSWIANTYEVKFNANGGNGSMSNQSYTFGQSQALSANAFTKEGYDFIGWATTANGEVVYDDKAQVFNLTATNNGVVELFAKWQEVAPVDITEAVTIENGLVTIPFGAITASGTYTITLEQGQVITIKYSEWVDKSNYNEFGLAPSGVIKFNISGNTMYTLKADVYGSYDNMKCYPNEDGTGDVIAPTSTTTPSGKLYTYELSDVTDIYYVNSSNYDVAFFSLVIGYGEPPVHEHEFVNGECACGEKDPNYQPPTDQTTVITNIAEYATANSWENAVKYLTIKMDEVIAVTATGGTNTGKYYTSGTNWRIYQGESGKIEIEATVGYIIESVKVTYNSYNTGVLLNGKDQVASGSLIDVNGLSIILSVGNTGSATNGQARITEIEVVYSEYNEEHEHEYQDGSCIHCGAEDPNYEAPSYEEPEVTTKTVAELISLETELDASYRVTGKVALWGKSLTSTDTTPNQYGNFVLEGEDGSKIVVFGATAKTTALTWDTLTGKYTYAQAYDFLTDALTSTISLSDTVELLVVRTSYQGTPQLSAIVLNVTHHEHEYQDGACIHCGSEDPDYVAPEQPDSGNNEVFLTIGFDEYTHSTTAKSSVTEGGVTFTTNSVNKMYTDNTPGSIALKFNSSSSSNAGFEAKGFAKEIVKMTFKAATWSTDVTFTIVGTTSAGQTITKTIDLANTAKVFAADEIIVEFETPVVSFTLTASKRAFIDDISFYG